MFNAGLANVIIRLKFETENDTAQNITIKKIYNESLSKTEYFKITTLPQWPSYDT